MQILDYKYFHGSELRDGYYAIPELNRTKNATSQFMELAGLQIKLDRPTAFLYVDGFSLCPSEAGLHPIDIQNYVPVIKTGSASVAHAWVHSFEGREWLTKVDIISSTCAAGIQAFYEADKLLQHTEAEEVIIIGAERTAPDTLRLFKELRIPVTCGDGFAYVRLKEGSEIQNCKWHYAYNPNPFAFTRETLNRVLPHYPVDYVKLHGTGTPTNEAAEEDLAKLGTPIRLKPKIGHTQGLSALIETCMVYDDPDILGTILVTANGLGGFYGALTLLKDD